MVIGVATSILTQKFKYNPFKVIEYAIDNKIPAIQFYMNEDLQNIMANYDKIIDLCQKSSITILCHSHKNLEGVCKDTAYCDALVSIFPQGAEKYCIFHFDENADIDAMITNCEILAGYGILPCIENYYEVKTKDALEINMKNYFALFDRLKESRINAIPVLDFPRLFVTEFIDLNSVYIAEQYIQYFANQKMIIHAIDSKSTNQLDRNNWCAVGDKEGIAMWAEIFNCIKKYNVSVEYTVLEYENTNFIIKSIEYLKDKGN